MKNVLLYFRLAIYLIVPVVLLALPADYFDTGRPKCISVLLLDQECFGCGLTRGMMHLIHFEFTEAIYYHYLSVVIFPLLAFVWARGFWKDWQTLRARREQDFAAA